MEQTVRGFLLSPQQTRLWLLQQRDGAPFRAQCVVRIAGRLDPLALAAAVRRAVARHEILRTTYSCLPGMTVPLQVIGVEEGFIYQECDLRGLASDAQRAGLRQAEERGLLLPFDYASGPLVSATLAALAPERHALVLTLPSLCVDRQGLRNLVREIARCYGAQVSGQELPEPPLQYADYCGILNDFLQSEDAAAGREYWRKQAPEALGARRAAHLPGQKPVAERAEFAPAVEPVEAAVADAEGLAERARALGVTEADLLLAAWAALLERLAGAAVPIGVADGGRRYPELQEALGLMARYLPVELGATGGAPLAALADLAGRTLGEHRDWQESHEPAASAASYLAYCFEYVEAWEPEESAGVSFAAEREWACGERFDLKLACVRRGGALSAELHYDGTRFERAEVERLAERWRTLLADALSHPERAVGELELLGESERRQVLGAWSGNRREYAPGPLVPRWIAEQAARHPERPAVEHEGERLSYGELASRSGQVASRLRALGVGTESRVGLCVPRSLEMVVGLLGILRAGGAYVPLDPSHPAERLEWLLADSGARLLLSTRRLASRLPSSAAQVLCLDEPAEWAAWDAQPDAEPDLDPAQLAYLVYTSGSTGRPKGVAVEHRQLLNYVQGIVERLRPEPGSRFGLVSTYAADLGYTMLYPALCTGGCLEVASEERSGDAAALAERFESHPVDYLKIVPSHLRALLSGARPERLLPRRGLVLGGEACGWDLVSRLRELAPGCALWNHYGPTETTVGALCGEVPVEAAAAASATAPLGRPLGNAEVYLFDGGLQPVPVGLAGEMYLGGAGVARGYLGQPDRTAERFVPHPFGGGGERLYRSGDLGRWLADGAVEFLGRADDQVKIRGYRVELGEIEAALRSHAGVREAAVLARDIGGGERQLVAYATPAETAETAETAEAGEPAAAEPASGAGLRRFLAERLPAYMVPAAVVILPRLPLTPNGKLDRQALPAPEQTAGAETARLRSPLEEVIAGTWSEVLNRPELVGAEQNFFDLGGHSLLATQVTSRLRAALGVEVPVIWLFDAPTVAALASRIERHRREQENLLPPPLVRVPRDRPLPLSFAQQRLWFLDQRNPGSSFYNTSSAIRLLGPLDVDALRQAGEQLVDRHEVLRTVFGAVQGLPAQIVQPAVRFDLPVEDLTSFPQAAAEALRMAQAESVAPFDLASGPLLRARLLRLAEDHHVLVCTMHHIVSDGWSVAVLVRELMALYAAFLEGRPSPLAPLAVQYGDFACWQRQWLQGEVLQAHLGYWRRELAGAPAFLELPTDRSRPAEESFRGAQSAFAIAADLAGALRGLARQHQATLFTVLLAAWQTLLHRYSGQDDIVVGTPIANRLQVEVEPLIGFFVNTLVLRTRFGGDPSMRQLLERVRQTTLGAYAHQDLPFEKLVAELQPDRGLSHTPLFRVMFTWHNTPRPELELAGLRLEPVELENHTSKFDLTLAVYEQDGPLPATFEYSTELFEAATVARMTGHLQSLLGALAAEPERPLSELELLSEAERRQLASWNGPRSAYDRERLLPRWIAEQDAGSPAIECAGRRLSYGELNARANQVAHRLRSLGAGAESWVALSAPRSLELLVGMLGILKAGAAYVPLDPGYPVERLAYMLEDSGAELVLAVRPVAERLPSSPAQVLWLDEAAEWAGMSAAEPELALDPAQAAYLIYTSGSTGQPKGVAVSHANLLHSTAARWSHYGGRVEGFLLVSSLSFDSSVAGLFWTLSQGGMVCLPAEGGQRDALALAERVGAGGITHLLCLPSLYAVLLGSADRLQSLRVAIVAGEICPPDLPERHRERLPAARFFNEYGPTEGTVWSTVWEAPQDGGPLAAVPIGRPIANADVWVVEAGGRPAPVGVAGEIHLGGGGVARGYVNRPALTAERFVPDGLSGEAGARLYRTGDRGRWSDDGVLSFLGRADRQVKLRGYRIELGEVESALRSHAAVGEAAVVLRDGAQGPRLVGYWSPSPEPQPAAPEAELRVWMQQRLPDYMVPSALIEVAEWPRTPNGKLDEQALPAPEAAAKSRAGERARSGVEEVVAAVWADVLGSEREPGREDSFFDLGGHSLLATQVVSRLRAAFEVDLTLPIFFEAPTMAGLAARIEQLRPGSAAPPPPLVAGRRPEPLPLSYSQQRLWFLDQLHPGNNFYNVNTAVRLRGQLSVPALTRALQALMVRHEVLRTSFPLRGGEPIQVIGAEPELELERIELAEGPSEARDAEARRHLDAAARRPFSLAAGRLFRALLVQLEAEDHLLLLTLHHIVSDGWSMGLLVRELTTLYAAFREGRPSPLPPLAIQYGDFAAWQRLWLRDEVLEEQLEYWRQQLAGAPATLELPTDHPRPAVSAVRGAEARFILPADLSRQLRALSRAQGVTLFMLLLAALDAVLWHLTGVEDMMVGTNVANRNRQETEKLVGFFVNQLVLRTGLGGDPSFLELLGRVRQTTLGAYAHQDLPFDMLVADIRPERTAARSPLVQVKLEVEPSPAAAPAIARLEVSAVESGVSAPRHDLHLSIHDLGGEIAGRLLYDAELFDPSTVDGFLAQYQAVLAAVVERPEMRLAELGAMLAAHADERRLAVEDRIQELGAQSLKAMRRRPVAVAAEKGS